jgi:hypothetical protein
MNIGDSFPETGDVHFQAYLNPIDKSEVQLFRL